MKINNVLFCLGIFIISSNCISNKEEDNYTKNFTFFKNTYIYEETKTASLNSFTSRRNKSGLEYLVNQEGELMEIRNWKNNHIDGYVYLYATNSNVKAIAYYKNDTIDGNYFLLDSIDGKLMEFREITNDHKGGIDNQVIVFNNGIINESKSLFIYSKKIKNNEHKLYFLGRQQFPFYKTSFSEQDNENYIFDLNEGGEIMCLSKLYCVYQVKDSTKNYAVGYVLNYRYPSEIEIKENGLKKNQAIGKITYIRLKLH